jgi:hypothetical protein
METFNIKELLETLELSTFFVKNENNTYDVAKKYKISVGSVYLIRYIEDLLFSRGITAQDKFSDYKTRIIQRCLPIIAKYYCFDSFSCFNKTFTKPKNMINLILNYLYLNDLQDKMSLFLNTIFTENPIDWDNIYYFDDNYKKQLMIYCQRNLNGRTPLYELQSYEKLENGCFIFHTFVYCHFEKTILGEGHCSRKKNSEQKAARNALILLGILS